MTKGLIGANVQRQQELLAALRKATENKVAQLVLIYVYANRLGTSQVDVEAVRQAISLECGW